MPRIIIGNPLGTAGEGMAQGADLVRREREHQARMKAFEADLEQASLRTDMAKRAEQMQIEDRRRQQSEAESLRGILGSMEGIPDDQKEWLSRLEDPKSIPVAFQLIAKDREERTRAQHQQSLDAELMASANDPEFPIDPGLAQATVAAYGDDYQGARGALRKLRTQQRHMQVQTQQRSFARGEMLNLMSTFPEAFRPPPPGMAATAEQDLIADLMDELDDDPLDIEKGSADYLGALAELRVLADPSLKGAHRRVSERYRQDFEAATRATAEVQGAGPRPTVGTVEQGIEGAQIPGDVQGVLDQEKRDHVQSALDAANGEDPDMVIGGSNADVQASVGAKLSPEVKAAQDTKRTEERSAATTDRSNRAAMANLQVELSKRKEDGDPLDERAIRTIQRRMKAEHGIDVSREELEAMYGPATEEPTTGGPKATGFKNKNKKGPK